MRIFKLAGGGRSALRATKDYTVFFVFLGMRLALAHQIYIILGLGRPPDWPSKIIMSSSFKLKDSLAVAIVKIMYHCVTYQ